MKELLMDEYDDFIKSYDEPKTTGLRINTLKINKEELLNLNLYNLTPIPWADEGFYYDEEVDRPGKSPLHESGAYYLQEPSAMSVVPHLDIKEGDKVLDMCAAPGGKSTYILSKLNDTGLLVSNEINPTRIRALGENLERFGARNCIITNTDSNNLRKLFTGYFDKVVIDAPCSGQGMFRKDEVAITDWSYAKVLECQSIQKEIIRDGYDMLKNGGILVYSTCTFAKEENEDVINEFISEYENAKLIEMQRIWPHKVSGEGHFVAKIQKLENEMLTPYRSFFKKVISKEEAGEFIKEPIRLVEWCKKEIQINNELNSQRIPMSPIGVWKARVADEKSRDIFFVAMARTLGIPARIDKVTGKVQYTDKEGHTFDVNFSTSSPVQATTGILRAAYKPIASLPDPKYYSHFTLSKFKDGVFQLLNYDEGDVDMGKGATWANLLKNGAKLDSGYYMLVTGSRMASGAVLSNITFFNVKPEATTDIELVMRESKEQVQVIGNFDSESLYRPLGDEEIQSTSQSILQTCGRGYFVVGVLGVGQEPTNHALRDIAALGSEFEKWGRKIVLLFPSEEQYKKFHPAEFQGLPSTIAYGVDIDNRIQNQIAKSMNLSNSDILPMFIIADTFNRVVFVSQGYTIGLGEQLMKTIHGL